MSSAMMELIWGELKAEIRELRGEIIRTGRIERAEIADSIPASTLADAPNNADGGLGDGVTYITQRWISNGRKSGEGAGVGTGVLAVFRASTNEWLRTTDYSVVVV